MTYDGELREFQTEMNTFSSDLWEKQKEKAIRWIMTCIKHNLKRPFFYFNYAMLYKHSRANVYMGDDTKTLIDEALSRLSLTDEFPKSFITS